MPELTTDRESTSTAPAWFAGVVAAFQFLTILPIPVKITYGEKELGRSTPWFPIVGLVIGGIAAALNWGVGGHLSFVLSSALLVVALIAASGGLHMDGLADTADGFFSSRPRERVLEIMKDSHTGAMGVIAIVCMVLLKVTALASVRADLRWAALLLMPIAGRCALVLQLGVLSYVRPTGGLATSFVRYRSKFDILWAILFLVCVGFVVSGLKGIAAGLCAMATVLMFSHWCRRKIGGFTGDTLGAACEIAELIPAIVLSLHQ